MPHFSKLTTLEPNEGIKFLKVQSDAAAYRLKENCILMALIIYIREENEQGYCYESGREVLMGQ